MALLSPGGAIAQAKRPPLVAYPRHPEPVELLQLLGGLLDKAVTVTPRSNPPREAPGEDTFRATYVTPDGALAVCVTVDVALGAGCAASLALVPPTQAEGWVGDGVLPEDAAGNLYEVLNVLSATFNDVNPTRHVKISAMVGPGEATPDELAELIARARKLEVHDVTVADYPGGVLRIFSA